MHVQEGCFLPTVDNDIVKKGNISGNFTHGKPVLLGVNANEGFLKLMKFLTKVTIIMFCRQNIYFTLLLENYNKEAALSVVTR
jgi:hypothetical protein